MLVSSISAVVLLLTEDIDDLLSILILFRYSDGLIRLFESPAGKLGGTNGKTRCLLTKFGVECLFRSFVIVSSLSAPKLTIVRSEQEEFRRLDVAKEQKVGYYDNEEAFT